MRTRLKFLPLRAIATLVLTTALFNIGFAADPQAIAPPTVQGPATGLADSAALRATVFGTPPQDVAPMPDNVPLVEINIPMPWAQPVPEVFWFDRKLRVWFSAQDKPAPLAIVISGTGGDGNTSTMSTLRGALYGAGYHVLTMPSPTFPGFIVSASSTGVAGDLQQDGARSVRRDAADHRSSAAQAEDYRYRCAGLQSWRRERGLRQFHRRARSTSCTSIARS